MACGSELERSLIVLDGPLQIELRGSIRGREQERAAAILQRCDILAAGRASKLQGFEVVIGEHLSVVDDPVPGQFLDPLGGCSVFGGSGRPRDLAVRDVPNQQVPEGELALALNRRSPRRPDQFLSGELVQSGRDGGFVAAAHRGESPCPEHLPDHCGVLEERLALRRERVQARRD